MGCKCSYTALWYTKQELYTHSFCIDSHLCISVPSQLDFCMVVFVLFFKDPSAISFLDYGKDIVNVYWVDLFIVVS